MFKKQTRSKIQFADLWTKVFVYSHVVAQKDLYYPWIMVTERGA